MYQLAFYVPEGYLEPVKEAVFAAGGGTYQEYDMCAWQTLGRGQFRPLDGADPFIGRQGQLENEPEYKVELLVVEDRARGVVEALLQAHPYEEVAYSLIRMYTLKDLS